MVKIRENTVILLSDEIKEAAYVKGSLLATKGQPTKEPVTVNTHDGVVTILVHSGRKKSKAVAQEFISKAGAQSVATQGGESGRPDELNFTFALDLVFKDGRKARVQLGQGNRMLVRNNWWFGTKDKIDAEPSSLKDENIDVGEFINGFVPPKYSGLVETLNETILKDLVKEVNVFKIK